MIDTAGSAEPSESRPRRHGRKVFIVLSALVVVVAATAISVTAVSLHYAHARALECACGLGWAAPDTSKVRETRAGSHVAMNVPSDPTRRHAFYVEIFNPSSVTQTVLGLPYDTSDTAAKGELAVSTQDNFRTRKSDEQLRYTTDPVHIPPGGQYVLRYSFSTPCPSPGRSLIYESIDVRVDVGWFTRTETIDFGGTAFVAVDGAAVPHCL